MAKQSGDWWIDKMGDKTHKRHISKYDRAQERGVGNIVARRQKLAEIAERYATGDVNDIKVMLKARGVEGISVAEKGNMTFTTFDGHWRIKVRVRYFTLLDDLAIQARDMMYDYVKPAMIDVQDKGTAQALLEMINDVFNVSSGGKIDKTKANRLLRWQITSATWQRARELLIQSMQSQRGKSYIVAEIRDNHQQDHKPIVTDITEFWPLDDFLEGTEC